MEPILIIKKSKNSDKNTLYYNHKYEDFYKDQTANSHPPVFFVDEAPPITNNEDHPSLPQIILKKIKVGTDCIVRQINSNFYLQESEFVVSDSFSYLFESYMAHERGTVVLTRKTNFGEFYIIFTDIKVKYLHDESIGVTLIDIVDGKRSLYPIPPKTPINLEALSTAYTLTEVTAKSSSQIFFGWSVPENNHDKVWWALYQGVMPAWSGLSGYTTWDWLFPKGTSRQVVGSDTVGVGRMSSGALYTFALFSSDWNLADYRTFTAP
ncbi:hypothetical protein [Dickeya fangzhongdai]|uniref:hypothetical protein n=1 Tax=Dickeya fangzhongdai TaxID=1778540 RepID=UPI0011AB6653|nr:hypothetical protein [Dickeya fangzhongdai]WOY02086.1 hypothetical protein OGM22_09940 [Dickeya fangzhongdai]WOY02718.1 hypothetical protein OGM21_12460 [Dickeya fangzhongdai]GGC18492.1 hypothetical protein GCM10007171_39820 [Dickeya fangzhongdai]